MTVYNGSVPTVSYSVQGGSPHLQALCLALQYTENEISLAGELQKLRLGIVVNEQTIDTLRTSQQLGLGPIGTPGYAACCAPPDSALKCALIPGLAQEATPATALELIHLWERLQTELLAEQGKAAAAVRGRPPARQNAQPVALLAGPGAVPLAAPVLVPAPAVPQQLPMPLDPIAGKQVEVEWGHAWWPAELLRVKGDKYLIHYSGYDASWDEWVRKDRMRSRH
jgi:hypothetical protein